MPGGQTGSLSGHVQLLHEDCTQTQSKEQKTKQEQIRLAVIVSRYTIVAIEICNSAILQLLSLLVLNIKSSHEIPEELLHWKKVHLQ